MTLLFIEFEQCCSQPFSGFRQCTLSTCSSSLLGFSVSVSPHCILIISHPLVAILRLSLVSFAAFSALIPIAFPLYPLLFSLMNWLFSADCSFLSFLVFSFFLSSLVESPLFCNFAICVSATQVAPPQQRLASQ